MPKCRVCHSELIHPAKPCPRCGFQEPAFFGDPARAEQLINQKADAYRTQFLGNFDFGITIYRWKDQDGTLALNYTERLSFGAGTELLGKLRWLDQPFARIPDLEKMNLELSVLRGGQHYRKITVAVGVPRGNLLQQVGISLTRDLTVQLFLKNSQDQTQSETVFFLSD